MRKGFTLLIISMMLIVLIASPIFILNAEKFVNAGISGYVIEAGSNLSGEEKNEERILDISVVVPGKYQNIQPGDMLQFQIELKNIFEAGRHDIHLDYYIKKNGIILNHRREVKAVETQASFLGSIKVPEDTIPGIYRIVVEAEGKAVAESTFFIKSSEINQIKLYLVILISAIFIVGGLIAFELHRLGNKK